MTWWQGLLWLLVLWFGWHLGNVIRAWWYGRQTRRWRSFRGR